MPTVQARLPALIASAGFKEENKPSFGVDGWRRGNAKFASIHYTLSGRGRLRFHDRETFVRPGQAMLLHFPSDHRYWIDKGERWEFFCLTLSGREAIRGLREIIERRGPVVALGQDSTALLRAADACAKALEGKIESPYQSSELAHSVVMELLHESIGHGQNPPAQPQSAFVAKVEQFCQCNLSRPIGVEDMARVAKKSRFYFSRQFEKARGISPGRYLARLRLEEAKKLLVNSKLVLKEIAALCGFGDSNYLCKVFRKTHGVSPGVYRAARNAEARRSGSRLGDARMRPEAR
jgi:AraC-like DNA-binding protein